MAIETFPRAQLQPVRSQTGGAQGSVEPVRDVTGQQMQRIGQGMQALGESITNVADSYQDQLDLATSARSVNLMADEIRMAMEDPQGGYLNALGMQAGPERRKQTFDQLQKARGRIEGLLQNETQRLNFKMQADRMMLSAATEADRHQEKQVRVYRAGETKQSIDTQIGEAIKLAGTDDGEVAKLSALRDADALADLYGWEKDSVQRSALRTETTTKLHSGVIDKYLAAGRSDLARGYLSSIPKGEMDEQQMTRAQAAVRTSTVADESTRAAFAYVDQAKKRGGSLEQQFKYATEIADYSFKGGKITAEMRDATIARIGAEFRRMDDADAARTNDAMTTATKWLSDNPMASITEMAKWDPQAYAAIVEAGQLPALQGYAANRRFVTEPKAFAEMMDLPASYFAGKTTGQLVRDWRGRLDDQDLRLLLTRAGQARGGSASKNDGVALTRTQRIVESYYKATGASRSEKMSDSQEADLYKWRSEIQKRIDDEPQEIDDDRLQQIIDEVEMDRVFLRSTTMGMDWLSGDPIKANALLTNEERYRAYVSTPNGPVSIGKVPDVERQQIKEALRAKGRPVTEANIVMAWMLKNRKQ